MIVCPGGGYAFCSKDEGEPVALFFARHGYHAFVLHYDCGIKHPFPTQLQQLAEAFSIVKNHMQEWRIDRIDIIGFFAGANLALSLGCFFDRKDLLKEFYPGNNSLTPSHILLGYPAITLHPIHPKGDLPQAVIDLIEAGKMPDFRGPTIREILLGKEKTSEKELESLNLLQYLRHDLPPIFAFGSYQDTIIQASDLTELARRLVELHVPIELHLFADGPHGVSLCDETVKSKDEIDELNMRYWTTLALGFLEHN